MQPSFQRWCRYEACLLQHAGPSAGAVVDQQFFWVAGVGEAADGVAGQAQLRGDGADGDPLGQQVMNGRMPLASSLGDPSRAQDREGNGARRNILICGFDVGAWPDDGPHGCR